MAMAGRSERSRPPQGSRRFFLAAVTCVLFALLCLMGLFFGPTKLIPMPFAIATLYFAIARPAAFAVG
jgi:hypothetical protein